LDAEGIAFVPYSTMEFRGAFLRQDNSPLTFRFSRAIRRKVARQAGKAIGEVFDNVISGGHYAEPLSKQEQHISQSLKYRLWLFLTSSARIASFLERAMGRIATSEDMLNR
jgi:hypothetical protein